MRYLPKALIANFVLFSATTLVADSQYQAPIHHDGRMPDGTMVYEQNMQSRPPNQSWIYDPAVSAQWRSTNTLPQGEDYNPSTSQTNPYQTNPSNPQDTRAYDQR